MKVLVIPDVHLKPDMFVMAGSIMRTGVADRAVCLMDIPDDWGHEYDLGLYEETFDEALRFQNTFPDTLWCYGNHDLSYVWNQSESGFSPLALLIVNEKLAKLRCSLPDDRQLAYIHRIDNVLFLHGALTEAFVDHYVDQRAKDDPDAVIKRINSLGCEEMWNNTSPVWFRPQYYSEIMYKQGEFLQVVGHTPVEMINNEWNIVSCDVFSTYPDGSPLGTEEFLLIDTVTWENEGIRT